jgi:hypothetical protein
MCRREVRAVARFVLFPRADVAMRGLAISFLTARNVA